MSDLLSWKSFITIILTVTVLDVLIIYFLFKRKKVRPIGYCPVCKSEIYEPFYNHFDRVHGGMSIEVKEKR